LKFGWQKQPESGSFTSGVSPGDWGVCLVEDCGNLGAGVRPIPALSQPSLSHWAMVGKARRRPLRCAGMDGRSYDWDCPKTPEMLQRGECDTAMAKIGLPFVAKFVQQRSKYV